ncbi:hypothetical protein CK203_091939 [Vitis vinifera]|uniref:Serine incorporator 3 n=1 Tax=Vitis vinifera TaxID=29760 RepID=A0A438BRH8_VITVI|nr:hypothetical protein CK203_091939 [Vitis vinifera]
MVEELPTALEQKSVECSVERKKSLQARYSYGIIFLLTNLSAWFIRDYGQKVFPQLQYLESCGIEGRDCFHTMGVLRLLPGVIHVNTFLYCFYVWNRVDVLPVCPKNLLQSQHIFITWTAILLVVMMAMSLHSKVNRGLLSSGIMASYIVFLCWSAIRSEPATENCNAQKQEKSNADWITVLSFLIAICAIVMATFSTGIDSQSFQFRKDEVQEEDDIPYKWSIDIGWASTWVKIVNECLEIDFPSGKADQSHDHEDTTQQIPNSALP